MKKKLLYLASAACLLLLGIGLVLRTWSPAYAQIGQPLPYVAFASASYTVTEGDTVTVTVTLSEASASTVTVVLTSTASLEGMEDVFIDTITFAPGETSKSLVIRTQDDSCCQGARFANGVLSDPSGACLGNPSATTITLLDNDTCP